MTDVLIIVIIALVGTVGGIWFGIVVLAPRMSRLLNRPDSTEEEPGDRPA